MKLIRLRFSIVQLLAVVLTIGFMCRIASAQDAGPAKELLEWVAKARKAGMTDQQIQANAALAGWQETMVTEALRVTPKDGGSGKSAKDKDKPTNGNAEPAANNSAAAKLPEAAGPGAGSAAGADGGTPKVSAGANLPAANPSAPGAVAPAGNPDAKIPASPTVEPGAGNPKPIMDRGVPEDYEIGAGDVLHIVVWHETDATVPSVVVRPDGKISMPLIKEVAALGLTPTQLEKEITQQLTKYFTAPDVTVVVTTINSKKIYAIGAVKKEGPIPYTYRMTVLQALSEAGGLTDYAKRKKIYVLRTENGREFKLPFDYDAVLKGEHTELNYPLIAGDTIVVPH